MEPLKWIINIDDFDIDINAPKRYTIYIDFIVYLVLDVSFISVGSKFRACARSERGGIEIL